jgi:uncharacterized YccA/Bax inhibitor family protein
MRTGNPALSDNTFTAVGRVARAEEAMTIQGTANKALLLLLCALVTASWTWIVIQAVGLTFGTCLALLLAYKSRMIRASENFKLGVVAATGGIFLFYLLTMILGFFGIRMPLMYGNSWASIGFSFFVVVIAALNLVLDFDFIEQGAARGAPKYMEWYGAFGLMVTLIWLYLEMLRLLAKLRSRE